MSGGRKYLAYFGRLNSVVSVVSDGRFDSSWT
jgi:hypothetical protein